ncbi:hypothetical protein CNC02355 [Cryptococcus deneoformans JEC21]|uniref:Uncharacterized protein n=1 Tax=Cryptococcus deneoformans (strain JEC21 / ATCC MYA-565) TaxID=214684 RepID=A0A0S2LIP3_CRYD1|nr:hypothetical protein CNC02355 [Cryptococcus neoformans var. neoformans JEC21]ALO60456.1 hypothetical protein CNC02355 [Cryptococcus neoformans var. neoformans JEC21]
MQAPSPDHSAADGINGPLNPFVVTPPPPDGKDDEIPGYVTRFGAYHTLIKDRPSSRYVASKGGKLCNAVNDRFWIALSRKAQRFPADSFFLCPL